MKNILIPTDFSKNAKTAIDYAISLYANVNCTFHILHSTYFINPESRTHITPHYVNKVKEEGEIKTKETVSKLNKKNTNSKHNFKCIICDKKLSIAIDKSVKENAIDFIVMGTKGTTASIDYFAGSNTIEIVKKIKSCPIIVVPDKQQFVTPKQIAFPTDFSRFYDDREIEPLKSITELYTSEIKVIHINKEGSLTDIQEYNKELLSNHLNNFTFSFHFIKDNDKKSNSIENFIEEFKIDLLVMVNYRHSLIENILREPVIKKLIFHPKIPVLIIPE
ncbi:universal stress protein [Aureibaculum marinum]|uniref:Universal stress protein n=1 Tax=Aureibaculum marinum TaxID=2487930 RepID=A0A3N4NSN1_9FLAO|nr:universal stress protein [Aureibaculum marinum]RPD98725.1 universal stress protein [Aureibaculum marinum]